MAGTVGLALGLALVGYCPCSGARADAGAGDHGCCAQQAGWRADTRDCCDGQAPATPATASHDAPAVAAAPSLAPVTLFIVAPAELPAVPRAAARAPAFSVLRI